MSDRIIKNEDTIVLISRVNKKKIVLTIEDKSQKILGLGIYNTFKLLDIPYGSSIKLGSTEYWVLPAKTLDFIDTLNRKAQIILPKDAALLGLLTNLGPGQLVIEGGLGSGALTIYLLHLVGISGTVITYENRSDFAKIGTENVKRAFTQNNWQLKIKDITKGIDEIDVDAVIVDIAEPWLMVNHAYNSLKAGGYFASYLPTVNQVEKVVYTMRELGFIEIFSLENLQRELVVKPGATRPGYNMLGHTGYITIGRKVLSKRG